MKIGLIFAGQGAQYPGMGKSLYDNSNEAKKIFDLAGEQIKDWCFNGTKEILRHTNVTQPCVYTVTMAAYNAFLEALGKLDSKTLGEIELVGMAGFSLGEYAALTASKCIKDFETGLNLVSQRGEWMNEAGLNAEGEAKGSMVAAFGERSHILICVEKSREDGILEGVNFNSPIQTVVAGDKEALERFKERAKELGIKTIQLSVSTAFHSPMMVPAVKKLEKLLLEAKLEVPVSKVYSNVTGKDITLGLKGNEQKGIAELMAKQTMSPVYWQEVIENMQKDGIDVLIELGPGKTLCSLAKKIDHELTAMNIEDEETLISTMETLKNMAEEGEAKC